MAPLTEAGGRSLLSDSGIAATEDLDAPLELLNGSNSSVATPPTFGDAPRKGLRKPEDHLRCCVANAVRPEFVAQPEDVRESLLDLVKAQQWKLKAVPRGPPRGSTSPYRARPTRPQCERSTPEQDAPRRTEGSSASPKPG